MRGRIALPFAVLLAALALGGCPGATPPPVVSSPPPPPAACDVPALRARLGTQSVGFTGCPVEAMVKLMGEEARQARAECNEFIAAGGTWGQRMKNWAGLLGEVERQSTGPIANTAHTALGIVREMPGSKTFREDSLDDLVKLARTLESQTNQPSPEPPSCLRS